jgi:hypothetical protein
MNHTINRTLGLLAGLLLIGWGQVSGAGLKLSGGVIQYQSWMVESSEIDWKKELEAMRSAGMMPILIQYHEHSETSFTPDTPCAGCAVGWGGRPARNPGR